MDELTRFARRLIEQLAASKDGVNRAVPIGMVRDKILPYRTHRRALMLESVEDYETVLLRLVAGERGFVRTLPVAAAQRCQEELAGANPDLGVLDEMAESTIQITSLAAAQILGDEADGATPGEAAVSSAVKEKAPIAKEKPAVTPSEAAIPSTTKEKAPIAKERPAAPVASLPARDHSTEESVTMTECPHCHHAMPPGREVVFCPWCGKRLIPFTCSRCQTELDSEWRHCITCGAPVKDPYRFT